LKLKCFLSLTLIFFALNVQASFLSDLFGTSDQKPQITQEDAHIIEEEIMTADEYMDSVDEPTDIEVFSTTDDSMAFDEDEEFLNDDTHTPYIRSQTVFLSFLTKVEKIYLSQHLKVKIKAIVTHENVNTLKTTFLNAKNVQILNKDASWRKTGANNYEITYILKALSTKARLPDFKVTAESKRGESSEILLAPKPKIVALREDREFSLVLSEDFTLTSHHAKKYDEKSNIVLLEINATSANLEDFHLPFAIRDGIDKIEKSGLQQSIFYFAIIPNDIKIFKFKYFDLLSNKYNIVSFDMILEDTTVSTQTDLNPQKSKLALYKAVALIVLAFIVFLFFLRSKKLYLLVIVFIVLAYVVYLQIPISKVVLEKDIDLKILPTKNSTIFYTTSEPTKADILLEKDGYIKVLLENKKIGWIDENLTKN